MTLLWHGQSGAHYALFPLHSSGPAYSLFHSAPPPPPTWVWTIPPLPSTQLNCGWATPLSLLHDGSMPAFLLPSQMGVGLCLLPPWGWIRLGSFSHPPPPIGAGPYRLPLHCWLGAEVLPPPPSHSWMGAHCTCPRCWIASTSQIQSMEGTGTAHLACWTESLSTNYMGYRLTNLTFKRGIWEWEVANYYPSSAVLLHETLLLVIII